MPTAPDNESLAEFADLILNVGRLIRVRTPDTAEGVPLNETERQVMRLVDLHPRCAPSEIAARGRLQRTNVSTALRSLEGKGMIERSTVGRHVEVTPTRLAVTNLQALHAAWGDELAPFLRSDASLRRCTELLRTLEERLTEPME